LLGFQSNNFAYNGQIKCCLQFLDEILFLVFEIKKMFVNFTADSDLKNRPQLGQRALRQELLPGAGAVP
jgi:hypothetical protein